MLWSGMQTLQIFTASPSLIRVRSRHLCLKLRIIFWFRLEKPAKNRHKLQKISKWQYFCSVQVLNIRGARKGGGRKGNLSSFLNPFQLPSLSFLKWEWTGAQIQKHWVRFFLTIIETLSKYQIDWKWRLLFWLWSAP